MNKATKRLIREIAKEEKGQVTAVQLLGSPEFKREIENNLIVLFSSIAQKKVKVEILPTLPKGTIAYTDGTTIYLSILNPIVGYYSSVESAYYAEKGLFFHEAAHILYSDYSKERVEKLVNLAENGELPYDDLGADGDRLRKALESSAYRRLVYKTYKSLENRAIDPHDEKKICDAYGKYVRKCITMAAESMRSSIAPVEMTEYKNRYSAIMSMCLQYVRYGEIRVLNADTLQTDENIGYVDSIKDELDIATQTDSTEVRFKALNRIMVKLLDVIIAMIDPQKEKDQQENNPQEQGQDPEHGDQTQSSSGSPQSGEAQSTQSTESTESTDEEMIDSSQSQQNTEEEQGDSEGSANEPKENEESTSGNEANEQNEEEAKAEEEMSNQQGADDFEEESLEDDSEQNECGNDGKEETSCADNEQTEGEPEESENQQGKENVQDDHELPELSEDLLEDLLDDLSEIVKAISGSELEELPDPGNEQDLQDIQALQEAMKERGGTELKDRIDQLLEDVAEKDVEKHLDYYEKKALDDELRNVVHSNIHKNVSYNFVRLTAHGEAKARYHRYAPELEPYSKRVQRAVNNALRDIIDGDTDKDLRFGKIIEASKSYRRDGRYFANRKAPEDVPEVAISILVDCSGSMSGERIESSRKAASLLHSVATALNIPCCVNGHDTSYGVSYYTAADYKQHPDDKYAIYALEAGSCNRDGAALEISVERLLKRQEEVKLLFLISDGSPNDGDYCGARAVADLRRIVKDAKKKGVEFFACAIGGDKEDVYSIYQSDCLLVDDLDRLPNDIAKILKKRLIQR